MHAYRLHSPSPGSQSTVLPKASWTRAYLRFLLSKDESMVLKVAPLAVAGILPIDILSSIIPVIGELDDIGFTIVLAVVAVRTIQRVHQYR